MEKLESAKIVDTPVLIKVKITPKEFALIKQAVDAYPYCTTQQEILRLQPVKDALHTAKVDSTCRFSLAKEQFRLLICVVDIMSTSADRFGFNYDILNCLGMRLGKEFHRTFGEECYLE